MSTQDSGTTVVLLIENDPGDIFLFRRGLARLNFPGTVRVVGSVSEAREYLSGHGSDRTHFPIPDLIVSDMNLPGVTGNAFLEWLRQQQEFAHIPFVFLSGTFMPAEEARAHELGVHGYVTKTADMNLLVDRLRNLLKFLPRPRTGSSEQIKPPTDPLQR